jgi:uncharacterized membrane protein YGL010W
LINLTEVQRRVSRQLAMAFFVFVFALIGVAFLVLATWIWLSGLLGSQSAALVMGTGCLVLSWLSAFAGKKLNRRPKAHRTAALGDQGSLVDAFLKGFELATKPGRQRF